MSVWSPGNQQLGMELWATLVTGRITSSATHTHGDSVAMVTAQEKAPLAGKHQSNPSLTLEEENSSFLLNIETTRSARYVLASVSRRLSRSRWA